MYTDITTRDYNVYRILTDVKRYLRNYING